MICDSVYDLSQLLQRFSPPTEDQGEDNNDTVMRGYVNDVIKFNVLARAAGMWAGALYQLEVNIR